MAGLLAKAQGTYSALIHGLCDHMDSLFALLLLLRVLPEGAFPVNTQTFFSDSVFIASEEDHVGKRMK